VSAGNCPSTRNETVGQRCSGAAQTVTEPMAARPLRSRSRSVSSYAAAAAMPATSRSRRLPVASGDSVARWSTAAVTAASISKLSVPNSNRSGTVSGAGISFSGVSAAQVAGSATTAA
jgi:hypothetical protein